MSKFIEGKCQKKQDLICIAFSEIVAFTPHIHEGEAMTLVITHSGKYLIQYSYAVFKDMMKECVHGKRAIVSRSDDELKYVL